MTTMLESARAAYVKARDEYHAASVRSRSSYFTPDRDATIDAERAAFAALDAARLVYFDACDTAKTERP